MFLYIKEREKMNNDDLMRDLEAMKNLKTGDSFTADHVHTLVEGIEKSMTEGGGNFRYVNYDSTAGFQVIGDTANSITGVGPADDTMLDTIFLMPNASTNPTATMMIIVEEITPSTNPRSYEFVYVGDLDSLPSDILTESDIINDLSTGGSDKVLSAEMGKEIGDLVVYNIEEINLTTSSPYFESTITGAYMGGIGGKIIENQYTGGYKITLFRLPSGNYKATKITSGTAYGALVVKFASTSDFVVGGTPSEIILASNNTSQGDVVSFTLMEETLVALVWGSSDFNIYAKVEKIEEVSSIPSQVNASVSTALSTGLDIVIPDVVYAIVGTELNIWNDAVALSIDKGLHSPLNYQIRWSCTKGLITERCFRFTPTDVGDVSCTCFIYNVIGSLVASKQFTIRVVAKNAIASSKNIVYFGDSLGGSAATCLYNNFNDSNRFTGTIPSMLGTKGTTNHYEAVGGYKWSSYATKGEIGYRIYVTGVGSMAIDAVYSDGSHHFQVIEVNIDGSGDGNCLIRPYYTSVGTLIMPNGTLTKISGGGDSSVPYTGAFQESVNPLWNDTTQQLDLAQYKQMLVSLGQLSSVNDNIDAVSFQFGINDSTLADDLPLLHTYIQSLYNLFVINGNPNCKFIIGLTTSSGNTVDGSGSNYGATNNWKKYLENTYKIRKYYLTLLSEFPNLRIATPNLYLDRYYGYAFGTRQISDRYTTTEQYHTNYVHPTTSGYYQMADAYLACYVSVLSE